MSHVNKLILIFVDSKGWRYIQQAWFCCTRPFMPSEDAVIFLL